MTRLTFIILTLFLTALCYIGYLSHLALTENRIGREALKELALKLADESLRQSGDGPANPALAKFALKKIDNLEMMPLVANPPPGAQAAAGLVQQARILLRGSTPQSPTTGPAAAQAFVYLAEAERLLSPPLAARNKVPIAEFQIPSSESKTQHPALSARHYTASTQRSVPGTTLEILNSTGTYRVQRGETLWGISKKLYSTPWRWNELWKANEDKLPVYKKMRTGTKLRLPG